MSKRAIVSAILFVLSASLFVISLNWHPYQFSTVIKIIPMIILIVYSLTTCKYQKPLIFFVCGLIFSTAGDMFLDIDRTRFFIFGLGSFLIAHLLYISCLCFSYQWNKKSIGKVLFVLYLMSTMCFLLWEKLGPLKIPVLIYLVVISIMGVIAALQKEKSRLIFLGAFIFMISDSIIAINKFLYPFEVALFLIISFYYTSQALLTWAISEMYQKNDS